jgi:hypothetical protein
MMMWVNNEIDIEYVMWNDDVYCNEHDVEHAKWK